MRLTNAKKTLIRKIDESLIEACKRGLQDAVLYLLQQGANPNIIDKMEQTPLVIASKTGKVNIISLLLEHGADVNVHDGLGHAALEWACMEGQEQAARLLLEHGADPIDIDPDPAALKPFNDKIQALLQEYARQEPELGKAFGM